MEFTPEMITKLNITEKNLLLKLYNKCQETTLEERINASKRVEWTSPGPAATISPKVLINPLVMAGKGVKVGHSMVGQASWVGHG